MAGKKWLDSTTKGRVGVLPTMDGRLKSNTNSLTHADPWCWLDDHGISRNEIGSL